MIRFSRSLAWSLLVLGLAACGDGTTESPPPPGSITGSVAVEGAALAGVTINLTGPAQSSGVSGADGSFIFTDLTPGQYTLAIVGIPAEFQFAQTASMVTVVSGQAASVVFAGEHVRTASITGTVLVDGAGFEAATLTLSGTEDGQTTSDGSGAFRFDGLRAGDYAVTLSGLPADLTFTALALPATLVVGGSAEVEFSGIRERPAVVTIAFLEDDRGFRIGPDRVRDELVVLVDVDEGTETVTKVTLFVDDDNVGEQMLPAEAGPVTAGSLATQRLRFEVNTVEVDEVTGGPRFLNGPHVLRVVADTEQSGPGAAETTLGITMINTDLIAGLSLVSGAGGVVSNGHRWWGGGDLSFRVVPIIYDPTRTISAIDVLAIGQPSANGGPSLDLGSGLGMPHQVTGPPFSFGATQAANDGSVEDDPAGAGHMIQVVRVLDGAGVDVTSEFVPARAAPLTGLYIDFVGPAPNLNAAHAATASEFTFDSPALAASIDFDDDATIGMRWLSSGVAFGISNINELGVGFVGGGISSTAGVVPVPQVDMTLNVNDLPLVGAPVLLFPDVASSDDLTERRATGYELEVTEIRDQLGNLTALGNGAPASLTGVVSTADDVAGDNASDEFGADFTGAAYANQEPNTNPEPADRFDWDVWTVFNNSAGDADHNFEYDVDDPTLTDDAGSVPSGITEASLSLVFDPTEAALASTTLTVAGGGLTHDQAALFANFPTTIVVTGDATVGGAGQPVADGAYNVFATTADDVTDPNTGTSDWWVVLVSAAPSTTLIDAPPGTIGPVDNASLDVTIKGRVERAQADLNGDGVFSAEETNPNITVLLDVFFSVDALCSTAADNAVPTEGTAPGNALDVSIPVSIDPTTREFFDPVTNLPPVVTLFNSGDGTNRNVCFIVTSTLEAFDNDNAADDLTSGAGTLTVFDWQ